MCWTVLADAVRRSGGAEPGHHLRREPLHLLGLVEERGEEDELGARLGDLAHPLDARVRRTCDRDRLDAAMPKSA